MANASVSTRGVELTAFSTSAHVRRIARMGATGPVMMIASTVRTTPIRTLQAPADVITTGQGRTVQSTSAHAIQSAISVSVQASTTASYVLTTQNLNQLEVMLESAKRAGLESLERSGTDLARPYD
jgi:hypothetical protein